MAVEVEHEEGEPKPTVLAADFKELFNLRHAQLRNVIERIFGALKRKFPIVDLISPYSLPTQTGLTVAYSAIFNFNRIMDPEHTVPQQTQSHDTDPRDIDYSQVEHGISCGLGWTGEAGQLGGNITAAERARAETRRDRIAHAMWRDYQAELNRRHNHD